MSDHDEVVDTYAQRQRRNIESKRWAKRDGQPWTQDEDDFLVTEWIDIHPADRDEVTVSQCLERTIEACRVRCEHIRARLGITVVHVTRTTEVYIGLMDDPEDRFWSPDYYTPPEG